MSYDFAAIEKKWRARWEGASFPPKTPGAEKKYVLEMFPYPSGAGMHCGHLRVYTIGDALARFYHMRGYDVIHPMGWDSFGLPSENAAKRFNVDVVEWTADNILRMKEQMSRAGWGFQWDREVTTSSPDYYKWTQWCFLYMMQRGLAFKKDGNVNWCEHCETVLANEQVRDNKCDYCSSEVIEKGMPQWYFKITDYNQRLLDNLDPETGSLKAWPDRIRKDQMTWIGRSEGAFIDFRIKGRDELEPISVFTTRPDTIFGVTYMTLAPEHPLVDELVKDNQLKLDEVNAFRAEVRQQSAIERTSEKSEKKGVDLGVECINPANGQPVKVLIANYALLEYGTGCVMAVPAHDQRDFMFARKYDLPLQVVINPPGVELVEDEMEAAWEEVGEMVNSGEFDGMSSAEFIPASIDFLESKGAGRRAITYRQKDWSISRQRFWGSPIPIIECPDCGDVPVPVEDLPVLLPNDVDLNQTGRPPLSTSPTFTAPVACPKCGNPEGRRSVETMDTFVDSSWYFLRFLDYANEEKAFDKEQVDKFMPVDVYVGGPEHGTRHDIYARFFQMAFYDGGLTAHEEPYSRLIVNGMVNKGGEKMSKSKGNVVDPLEICDKFGGDAARLFILNVCPNEMDIEWDDTGDAALTGRMRQLKRIWRLVEDHLELFKASPDKLTDERPSVSDEKLNLALQKMIKQATDDMERFHHNTAISALDELTNAIYDFLTRHEALEDTAVIKSKGIGKDFVTAAATLIRMLSPFAPFACAELYEMIGNAGVSIESVRWPGYDESVLKAATVPCVVQVNGKLRDTIEVTQGLPKDELERIALSSENVKKFTEGKEIVKIIVVDKRPLVNIVVKG